MKGKANEDYKCRMYGKTMQIKTKGNQDVCTQKLTASSLKLDKLHSKNKLHSHVKVNVEVLFRTLHCRKIWNIFKSLKQVTAINANCCGIEYPKIKKLVVHPFRVMAI